MAKQNNTTVKDNNAGGVPDKTGPKAVGAAINFADDANRGMEGTDRASFAIPFLLILQGLSPALKTVEGARPGLFMNTITNELFKEVIVVPCAFARRYLRWAPRSAGGGYRGDYSPVDVDNGKIEGAAQNDEGQWMIGEDLLKDTRNHYVLMQSSTGAWQMAMMSLSSTQIKKSKRWMSRIQGIELRDANGKPYTPASYSHMYRLKTVDEKNNEGSWSGLDVELVGPVTDVELYAKAKGFNASVVKGEIEVTAPVPDIDTTGEGSATGGRF